MLSPKVSSILGASILVTLVILAGLVPITNLAEAHKHKSLIKHVDVTTLKELGDKIGGLSPSSGVRFGNVVTCSPSTLCIGTNGNDIILGAANDQIFGLGGNDIIYGGSDNQIYGGKGNSILVAGTSGNNLVDAGSGDDVILGGSGNDLLVGGTGNDKIFAGSGNGVMFGGSGAVHFDCPTSTSGLTKAVVLDYNPSHGDTISGTCKIVNTVSSSNPSSNIPQVNVPSTIPGITH